MEIIGHYWLYFSPPTEKAHGIQQTERGKQTVLMQHVCLSDLCRPGFLMCLCAQPMCMRFVAVLDNPTAKTDRGDSTHMFLYDAKHLS